MAFPQRARQCADRRGVSRFANPPVKAEVVRSGPRQLLYVAGVFLMIALTGLAGYLLYRDIRRENRLAILRSQFVASVSHELRTPIATNRAFAEMIDMGRIRDDAQRAEYVKAIVGETARLSRLVEGVLSSRASSKASAATISAPCRSRKCSAQPPARCRMLSHKEASTFPSPPIPAFPRCRPTGRR